MSLIAMTATNEDSDNFLAATVIFCTGWVNNRLGIYNYKMCKPQPKR